MGRSPGYFTLRSFLERKGKSKVRVSIGTVQRQMGLDVRLAFLIKKRCWFLAERKAVLPGGKWFFVELRSPADLHCS